MADEDETKLENTDAAKGERAVSQQAKQQPDEKVQGDGNPDEGTRPGDLSSESDGGSQG